MLDLTFVTMEQCQSLSQDTAEVDGYIQTGLGSERRYPQCSCPAYRYGKRTVNFGRRFYPKPCKHIEQAQKERCGWHQQWSSESQETEGVCPRCGRPTESVQVAV